MCAKYFYTGSQSLFSAYQKKKSPLAPRVTLYFRKKNHKYHKKHSFGKINKFKPKQLTAPSRSNGRSIQENAQKLGQEVFGC